MYKVQYVTCDVRRAICVAVSLVAASVVYKYWSNMNPGKKEDSEACGGQIKEFRRGSPSSCCLNAAYVAGDSCAKEGT
jgi:hypothetical protein